MIIEFLKKKRIIGSNVHIVTNSSRQITYL